jgi:hypothetical protein
MFLLKLVVYLIIDTTSRLAETLGDTAGRRELDGI